MTEFLCDTNVWLALAIEYHDHVEAARAWLDSVSLPSSILFCRSTQQSFVRLVSTNSVLARYGLPPLSNEQAWVTYDEFMRDSRISLRIEEPAGLEPFWRAFSRRRTPSPKLWMDAYLAAFARAGSYQLVTTDRDFRQFDGLDVLLLGAESPA
ncbi:MAG TPA: TA system VapC family ribonuclease toxin [Dehalococcoidia bacterium]|nr:TA system VapC family ribonuclease toxin [Dehalococcoidia bacterium]